MAEIVGRFADRERGKRFVDGLLRRDMVLFDDVDKIGSMENSWVAEQVFRVFDGLIGEGKRIVTTGVELLRRSGCSVIGLETMPRTMDNIGFYSGLGFVPARLTVTLTLDAATAPRPPRLLSSLRSAARDDAIRECAAAVDEALPGFDYTREIELTHELSLGDTLLMYDGDRLTGFAVCHAAPLVEGRAREELRVLKAFVRAEAQFDHMAVQLADLARRTATARVAIRLQGDYSALYARLIGFGARVRWTDLRMVLAGYEERAPKFGVALSNWEI